MLCIYIDVLQICIYECKSNTNTYTVYLYNTYYMHMIMLIFVYSIYIISSFFANPQSPAQHAQEHQLVVRVFGLREGGLNENDWKCILENHWIGFLFVQGIQKVCPEREAVSKKVTGEESQFCRNETTIFFEAKEKIKDVQVISKSFGKRCANHLEGHTRMIRTNWQKKTGENCKCWQHWCTGETEVQCEQLSGVVNKKNWAKASGHPESYIRDGWPFPIGLPSSFPLVFCKVPICIQVESNDHGPKGTSGWNQSPGFFWKTKIRKGAPNGAQNEELQPHHQTKTAWHRNKMLSSKLQADMPAKHIDKENQKCHCRHMDCHHHPLHHLPPRSSNVVGCSLSDSHMHIGWNECQWRYPQHSYNILQGRNPNAQCTLDFWQKLSLNNFVKVV